MSSPVGQAHFFAAAEAGKLETGGVPKNAYARAKTIVYWPHAD